MGPRNKKKFKQLKFYQEMILFLKIKLTRFKINTASKEKYSPTFTCIEFEKVSMKLNKYQQVTIKYYNYRGDLSMGPHGLKSKPLPTEL